MISNWTGRPVFFCTIVARRRTFAPEQMSSNRSLTRSQARSLLSIAKLKIARSRFACESSKRTRMDQTCFGSRGFFWPISNPLFQGRLHRLTGRTDIRDPPPSRPPRRSIASVQLYTDWAAQGRSRHSRLGASGAKPTFGRICTSLKANIQIIHRNTTTSSP